MLSNYQLAGFSLSRKHGLATFVHKRLKWTLYDQYPTTSETEWLCVDVDGYKIVNIYKPPPKRLQVSDLQCLLTLVCMRVISTAPMSTGVITPTARMKTAYWPGQAPIILPFSTIPRMNLAFILGAGTLALTRILPLPPSVLIVACLDRRILEKFPRSQHRPSLITPPRLSLPVPGRPVKRWNFCKANWSHYKSLTNKLARNLPSPDSTNVDQAYQDLCNTISKAAKKAIPRGRRNIYVPCWDAKCEALYQTFLQSPAGDQSSRAATALITWLDKKRRDRWSEAVRNIDFSHSSRKASSIINNLTGRSPHSPRNCPVSANAIAAQLVRNGKYEGVDRESSRLISQEVSDR